MSTATPVTCDIRGIDYTLYINLGTESVPIWVEHLGITGDITVTETEDDNELTTRNRNRAFKEYVEGDTDLNITGTQVMDALYVGWQYLYAMRTHGDARDILALSQPISEIGAIGFRGMMRNKDRSVNAPASGAMTQNFSLRPAACTETPVRVVRVDAEDAITDYDPTVVEEVES